ncbi:MAG: hypothetical protein GF368_02885 [Candidatus Aenigmarchaeota archaeon]|nr:hypothetical protein [Candidatus Aenigmarchaeota archaeon]
MDVSVIGSAMLDTIVYTDRLERFKLKRKQYLGFPYSSKTEIDKLRFDVGGSGHNIAVGLSKLGNQVVFIGRIGDDPNGEMITENFDAEGVDITYLKKDKDKMTGFSQIFITPDGEKSLLTYRGANNNLAPEDIPEDTMKSKWFVFTTVTSDQTVEAVKKSVNLVKKGGGKILANPSITMVKHRKRELTNLIRQSDVAIMNKEEVCSLTDTRNEKKGLKALLDMGVKSVVVTLGKNGIIGSDRENYYKQKPYSVKIRDATGAGDGFTAGFLHWFMKTGSFRDSLMFGNATAALNIESVGATKNLPSEKDIINLMGR